MSLDPAAVFSDGIDEFLSRKALALAVLFAFVGALGSIAGDTFGIATIDWTLDVVSQTGGEGAADTRDQLRQQRERLAWGLDLPLGQAAVLVVASFLVGELARIGAVRALADADATELSVDHFTANVGRIFLNRVVVALLSGVVLLATGFATVFVPSLFFQPLAFLGLLPFVYVAIGLYFASFAVTLDEDGPIEGLRRAWQLASGNRLVLALIALAVALLTFVVGIPTAFLISIDPGTEGLATTIERTPTALVASALVGAITTVFRVAIAAATYLHLVDAERGTNRRAGADVHVDEFDADTRF